MDILESYRGKQLVVTGCHSGIGRATAQLLVESGARVHGLDIKPTDIDLAAFTLTDLRDAASIEAAAEAVHGPVDALFNCAGVPPGPSPLDVMTINFIGTRHLTNLLLPAMEEGSAIVTVASNGGAAWQQRLPLLRQLVATESFEDAIACFETHGGSVPAAYSFSKEALIVWTLHASTALIKRGIRMNCTSPGAVQTPMLEEIEKVTPSATIDIVAQPIGRRSNAEEQAWPLLFLNSELASYVNGAVFPVDGGFLAQRSLDQ